MIVYKSHWQAIEDGDVVLIDMKKFYIVAYDMKPCHFILYPLDGHTMACRNLSILDHVEWEYLGHVSDEGCYTQLKIEWGIGTYIAHMESLLSHNP